MVFLSSGTKSMSKGKLVETPLQFDWIWAPDRNRALHRNNPKQECALDSTCNI